MVYIINAQDCESSAWNLARIRNRLFTAITRSKAWVRVLGIGDGMRRLEGEFERLKKSDFELRFRYPTRQERNQMMIVHRDISAEDRARLSAGERSLRELVSALESGSIYPDDLDSSVLERLRGFLTSRGN
jgi:superfamily I DNA and RNA helicase